MGHSRLIHRRPAQGAMPTILARRQGQSRLSARRVQAEEAKLREVIPAGGFSSLRRTAETPFNMVLEARP